MTTSSGGMSREQIEAFLAEPRNIMVAALRSSGRPQMTPNWFYWDGSRFYVSTTKSRDKYRNFKRDPRVQLCLDEPTGFKTIIIDGDVEVIEDIEAGMPYLKQIRAKHGRPVTDEQTLREELTRDQRVMLAITPRKPPEQWTRWLR